MAKRNKRTRIYEDPVAEFIELRDEAIASGDEAALDRVAAILQSSPDIQDALSPTSSEITARVLYTGAHACSAAHNYFN